MLVSRPKSPARVGDPVCQDQLTGVVVTWSLKTNSLPPQGDLVESGMEMKFVVVHLSFLTRVCLACPSCLQAEKRGLCSVEQENDGLYLSVGSFQEQPEKGKQQAQVMTCLEPSLNATLQLSCFKGSESNFRHCTT